VASKGPDVSFSALVLTLSTSAWVALGKVADPISGEIKQDLNGAKYTIDLLMMLREKTEGNLADEESQFLRSVLGELQANYAEMVFGGGAEPHPAEADRDAVPQGESGGGDAGEAESTDAQEGADTPSAETNENEKGE
jgi:hypothetical protein